MMKRGALANWSAGRLARVEGQRGAGRLVCWQTGQKEPDTKKE
jgi:hypothetical protein